MKTALALVLALAATAAQAQTLSLRMDYAVCESIEVMASLTDTSIGREAWVRQLDEERASGHCTVLPPGTEVVVDKRSGMFACIRPVNEEVCGWAVMHSSQMR